VSVEEYAEITILVGERDVTSDVIFSQTSFQVAGSAAPGSCQITLRNLYTIMPGRDLISLYINGKRMWWGYPFVLEQGFVFPDDPEPRMTLHGVDLNILFEKLVLYKRDAPTKYPDGAIPNAQWAALTGEAIGTDGYYTETWTSPDGQRTGKMVKVPPKTMDRDYIMKMLRDFDLDKVHPLIKWGQPPLPPSECRINEISSINTEGGAWTPPSAGTSLRAFFTDVSANIVRSQPGSAVWYIDPEGYIVWRDQDFEWAPFTVGDAPGGAYTKNLSVTTDVSRLKNDVLVFTGMVDPQPQSTQEFLRYVHKINTNSVNQFGRFQWSETMGSSWTPEMITARANKLLTQEGGPAMRSEFTVYRSGLYPGQLVRIVSSAHTFTTFDSVFGLQTTNDVILPIRAIDMTFPTPNVVEYRATCSYDTNDPWGLLLALKRPPARGLVQPNFNVIDKTHEPTLEEGGGEYITASGMIHVKEWPDKLSGNHYQTTYAYIRNSMTVAFIDVDSLGRKVFGVPDPANDITGFMEDDPDLGIFSVAPSMASHRVYCEYHVWHNLDKNAV
jgi:hypothetical protein